jgi:uncharacterized protein YcfL
MFGFFSDKVTVRRPLILGALLACTTLSGCATTAGIEASGKKSFNQEGERTLAKNVVFNNSAMAGDIEIVDLKSSRAGDLMKAQVTLRSTNRDTMNIQYAFQWFDAQGMELGGTTVWKPFMVYGKETRTVQGVAPDPRGSEFKLKVRGNDE